jgi:hypothetical protein
MKLCRLRKRLIGIRKRYLPRYLHDMGGCWAEGEGEEGVVSILGNEREVQYSKSKGKRLKYHSKSTKRLKYHRKDSNTITTPRTSHIILITSLSHPV